MRLQKRKKIDLMGIELAVMPATKRHHIVRVVA